MRRYYLSLFVLAVACTGGERDVEAEPRDEVSTGGETTCEEPEAPPCPDCVCPTVSPADEDAGTIRIATFNIRDFGPTKAGRADVMDQLATIVRRYDIVAVQEISDSRNRVPTLFLDHINAMAGPDYAMSISPRSGVHPDDRRSAEQYGFYWNTERIDLVPSPEPALYPEPTDNVFDREPWVARFQVVGDGGFSFVLATVHTDPNDAVVEIGALHDVVGWARGRWSDEDDFIVLGDYNAGCGYATPDQLEALDLAGTDYRWIVPHTADTNFSPRSACAYDRIVTSANTALEWTGAWGVENDAFTDPRVSDHWPVWAEFSTSEP